MKNKRGFSSGLPSPDVGMGWNICGRKVPLVFNEDDRYELWYNDDKKETVDDP